MVNRAAAMIATNAPRALLLISTGDEAFRDPQNPSYYAFVYDTNVVMVAHPDNQLLARCFHGVPDIRGRMFRDDIVQGALAHGSGWVSYSYRKPGGDEYYHKETYYRLVRGSDGADYVVCCGRYLEKE